MSHLLVSFCILYNAVISDYGIIIILIYCIYIYCIYLQQENIYIYLNKLCSLLFTLVFLSYYVDPSVVWGSTYCFTDVGIRISITPITKGTPTQFFCGRHVFCSLEHWLLIFAMTLTFCLKVKP